MTDEADFLRLMRRFGVVIIPYRDRRYMHSDVKPKQDVEYSINKFPDVGFHFRKGKFLGTTSSGIKTFEKRMK